jgi:2-haloacid dehalogenase
VSSSFVRSASAKSAASLVSRPSPVQAVLCDLLMGVMNSVAIWTRAAGDERRGLEWRDAVTAAMVASGSYVPYEELVASAAAERVLPREAVSELFAGWRAMEPWPDSAALARLELPYAFVTNCSTSLARLAAERSGLTPEFVLSAEEAGWYKPARQIYEEACGRIGSRPESTLFVAGSAYDADGAAGAGLPAVLVARRPGDRERAGRTSVVASVDDVVTAVERRRLAVDE